MSGEETESRQDDDGGRRHWTNDDFSVLDDSVANLLRQVVLAVGGMFFAYALAEWVTGQLWSGRTGAIWFVVRGLTFCAFGGMAIFVTSALPIRRALIGQRNAIDGHERRLQAQSDHHRLVGRLQTAFGMAESDQDAFKVVGASLAAVVESPAELLLADSSRAHLRRVAVSTGSDMPGCGVATPWGCPAVRRSRTLVFEDSEQLDACPRLAERDGGAASALCVPVTVLGTPMGVLHVAGEVGHPPVASERSNLEVVAEQAGSRIGVLRAMAASQLQATTDPLTGLLNRRSLEAELQRLRDRANEFAVAFLDLDHFKDLNDTFGHETGDRALRSFSRLLRRAVRDHDLVCRYGGEEFVVVLPDTVAADAEGLFARVSDALASAVAAGEVPPFTVSVGLADSLATSDTAEVVNLADAAMYEAKQAGRNRIRVASSTTEASMGSSETMPVAGSAAATTAAVL